MKILHLIDHMGAGGAQEILLDLLEVRSPGMETQVCALRDHILPPARRRLEAAGVPYDSLGLSKSSLNAPLAIRSRVQTLAQDIVHAHLDFANTLGLAAALTAARGGSRFVGQFDNDPKYQRPLLNRLVGRLVAPKIDAYIVLCPSIQRSASRLLGISTDRLPIIPPGINLHHFNPQGAIDQNVVQRLRGGARRVLGTVARLVPQKGLDHLIDSLPVLLETEPSTRLLLVGDGPLRRALERKAENLGVSEAVSFTGHLDRVVEAYRAMDVLVLPSRYEGFGLVLAEAMAMGVPIVATNVVGIEDVVTNGSNGLLVPYGDPIALAGAALRLFEDLPLRERLVSRGHQEASSRYTREQMAARTEALYDEILRRHAADTRR
jgi:glycosyltransferase involved in cell wall biosynthesis